MQYDKIKGLDKNISKLIIGNDNQTDYDEAAKLWDHWVEVGGNSFDNAHIYGGGSMETLLGKWHKLRNNLARKGRIKYHKKFNSTKVAEFMISKIFNIKKKFNW